MIARLERFALVSVSIFALAACSGSSTPVAPIESGPVTWTANVGASSTDGAFQGLGFYRSTMTIDVGDSIAWTIKSTNPHTITLLAAGTTTPPPPAPANLAPMGGTTFDGSTLTSSGLSRLTTVYKLTFTKAGTFTVYCLIHQPEMMQTITVQPAGTPYPTTQAQYTADGAAQSASDVAGALASLLAFPFASGGAQVAAGIAPGLVAGTPSASTVLRFVNGNSAANTTVTIPVGGTVTWSNESNDEPHTVTFGIAGQPFPTTLDPFGPKIGGATYDGGAITNSGVLPPVPGINTYSLQFTKAGTYTYHCLIHDDDSGMIGTVIVQ